MWTHEESIEGIVEMWGICPHAEEEKSPCINHFYLG